MQLYSLTLQKSTSIQKAIYGNFSGPKAQEIVVSKVKHIELWKINENTGKMQTIVSQEVFGIIRSIQSFRFPGNNKDNLVIGSDSGRVIVLGFDTEKNAFQKVHQETYGKTGCRRIVPGQYMACDPKGRAFMISAVEKNKFVYIINRENEKITISSPLEAPKSHTIVFDIVGLDAGYDNAQFAAIESDYGDWQDKDSAVCTGIQTKFLTIYEMDFGLNTVRRKTSDPIHISSHLLLMVPNAPDGPGGVVILCEDFLHYKGSKNQELKVPYPKRLGMPSDRGAMICSSGFYKHKNNFFYILQSEYGDLFELNLNFTKDEVHNVTLQYFDTIPRAVSLCIMRSKHLFVACDRGNHMLYKYLTQGKDEQNPIFTISTMSIDEQVFFSPRKYKHLQLEEEINNFSCITDLKVADLCKEGNRQIYVLCAAGIRSSLRVLRYGLAVAQLANTQLPVKPLGIWTLKEKYEDAYQKYIVLTFSSSTIVLLIGDKVEEIHDSGLEATKQTIFVGTLEDSSIIQITTTGFKHIKKNKPPQFHVVEGKVTKGTANERQVAIGLAGGEVQYFELDQNGALVEIARDQMDNEVTAIELGPIEFGRMRCSFLCVGLSDQTVRLLSLDPETCFERGATQTLPSQAESLCMMEMSQQEQGEGSQSFTKSLFLFVGLNSGVLIRTSIDSITGQLSDTRTRFLGTKSVKCFRIMANGAQAMLALSSRSWLCYNNSGRIFMQPLSYDALDQAAAFISKDCQGIVGTYNNSLRIIMPDKYGEIFNQQTLNLDYSPRKMIFHENTKTILIIESENRAYSLQEKKMKIQEMFNNQQEDIPDEQQFGSIQDKCYKWASLIRIVDPLNLETLGIYEFLDNQHACSICAIQFAGYDQQYICVGTVKDLVNEPTRQFTCGFIHTFVYDSKQLKLKHTTPLDEVPYSLASWRGRLLVGAGCNLRVYELGNQRVLKKAEIKSLTSFITNIMVKDDRIYVAESADSIHLLRYKIKEQTFMELADDVLPRYVTASTVLDYHTIISGDKFENLFVSRVPLDIDEEQEEHPYEYKMKMDQGCMNGAPFKMDQICNYYVGEVITSLQKTALVSTSNEVVVYGTTMGCIGAMYPFDNREDVDFFLHLEMYMRVENQPLSGRDHMMFRSAYGPCKAVIDGDLCEQFGNMTYNKQKMIAEEFDRTPVDIVKKLEDIRNKIL